MPTRGTTSRGSTELGKRKRASGSTSSVAKDDQAVWTHTGTTCFSCKLKGHACEWSEAPSSSRPRPLLVPHPKCKRCSHKQPSFCCPDPTSPSPGSATRLLTRRAAKHHRQHTHLLRLGLRKTHLQRLKRAKLQVERTKQLHLITLQAEAEARAAARQRVEAAKHRQEIDDAIQRMKETVAHLQDGTAEMQFPNLDDVGTAEEDPKAIMESLAVLMAGVAGLVACTAAEMRAVKMELESVKRELSALKTKNAMQSGLNK